MLSYALRREVGMKCIVSGNLEERECCIGQSLFDGMMSVYFYRNIFHAGI